MKPRGGGDDDARAFEEAVRGAKPLPQQARAGRVPLRPTTSGPPPRHPKPATPKLEDDGGEEALASSPTFEIVVTGDAIAGRARGVDARLLRKLKAGEPVAEVRLDLHGRARAPALEALARFVTSARADGRRSVLVIHGRGAHSADDVPVIKPLVWRFLARSPLAAQAVLAFASARPAQGGDGATLVLLRRA